MLAALVHGATHEGSSWVCAWEPGIYKGKDKRETNVIKEPGAVGLKVSMLPVRVSSDDNGRDQRRLVEEEAISCMCLKHVVETYTSLARFIQYRGSAETTFGSRGYILR